MPQELFITVDTLLRRLSMKRQGALTLLCKFTLSNFVPRISGLILVALAVSYSPHAAAPDDIVPFQAGGTPLRPIDQKVQPIDFDHCGGEVASIELPTELDATSNVVRIRSDGIVISQVHSVTARLLTSDRRSVNSLGEQPRTKDLSHVAAPTPSAQRAVMFDEDRNDPRGKSYAGFVSWHAETARAKQGTDIQRSIQAEVDVPDRAFNFVLCMWPDSSQSLTPSHSISVIFAPTAGTPHGGISELAGITPVQHQCGIFGRQSVECIHQ